MSYSSKVIGTLQFASVYVQVAVVSIIETVVISKF